MHLTTAQRLDRLKVRTAELSHWRERATLGIEDVLRPSEESYRARCPTIGL